MFSNPFCKKTLARESHGEGYRTADFRSRQRFQQGFSLLEMTIVIAILLILAGISAPKVLGMIEAQRLQSATRAYATFLQESRYRSEQDGQWYEVQFDQTNPNTTIAFLDITGNGVRGGAGPQVEIPFPITIPDPANAAVPAGFGNANLLGATPLTVDTKPFTWNCVHAQGCANGQQVAGLQFNERGLPCQRTSNLVACTNTTQITSAGCPPSPLCSAPVAWITYFAYPTSGGGNLYAAITVTPAGRIKIWNFQSDGAGGGTWQ